MTKYQEFLNKINVIPEDLFYEVLDSLPEYDSDKVDFLNIYDYDSNTGEINRMNIVNNEIDIFLLED